MADALLAFESFGYVGGSTRELLLKTWHNGGVCGKDWLTPGYMALVEFLVGEAMVHLLTRQKQNERTKMVCSDSVMCAVCLCDVCSVSGAKRI